MVRAPRPVIRLASPDVRPADIERAVRVIASGQLVHGPHGRAFEQSLAKFTGVDHCALVSSGTAALHLALLALGIGEGDAVLVPAFTFPATANVVERVGARVLLCDVDPKSYVVTPELVDKALCQPGNERLKAVIVVHEFGCPADMRCIVRIARRRGLHVIEDAACALGSKVGGRHVGFHGDIACFSFHPRKAVTTGEGGAVLARRRELIGEVIALRNHGIRTTGSSTDFVRAGLNYRLTDFQAALAIGQLRRFPSELHRRRLLAERYFAELSGQQGHSLPRKVKGHSWQSFMVVLDDDVDRKAVIDKLFAAGIEANLGAQAMNCLDYYRRRYGFDEHSAANAARLYKQGLVLPLHGRLTARAVQRVCSEVRSCLGV